MALDDSYYMKQALQEAQKAGERGEVPVGAVVVCKDRIIARAHNLTETLDRCHRPCRDASHYRCRCIRLAANI